MVRTAGHGKKGHLQAGAWIEDGDCRGMDTSIFFPERGKKSETAKAICDECPVREPCGVHGVVSPEKFGIWGGLSERQRRLLRKDRTPEVST